MRAGVLEQGTVDLLIGSGRRRPAAARGTASTTASTCSGRASAARIDLHGADRPQRVGLRPDRGRQGPHRARGSRPALPLDFEVSDTALHDVESDRRGVTYATRDGRRSGLDVRRRRRRRRLPRPRAGRRSRTRCAARTSATYPFAWLGILAEAPPSTDELIYAWHPRRLRACTACARRRSAGCTCRSTRPSGSRTGPTTGSGTSCATRLRAATAGRCRPGRCSTRASRRCAASSARRCGTAGCSSPATPRTSSRRPAPRGSTSPSPTSRCSPDALVALLRDGDPALADAYEPTRAAPGLAQRRTSPGG